MTTRLSLSAPWVVLLALLAGCDWGSKPSLPGTATQDASYADVGIFPGNDATAQADTAVDVPPPPDVPPASDAPVTSTDGAVADVAPPPFDAAAPDGGAGEDCRFMPSRDGVTPPAGAVVVDGGFYANDRNEACDPTPRGDGGADASDATDATDASDATDATDANGDAVDAAVDGADATSDGVRP